MKSNRWARSSRAAFLAIVSTYLIFPTFIVIWLSFGQDQVLRFPPNLFTWDWYIAFATDEDWVNAVIRTGTVGFFATVTATIIGTAAAFAVSRGKMWGKQAIEGLAIAPLVVPPIVLAAGGYSLYLKLNLVGSFFGLSLMHALLGLPYVFLIVSVALARTDPNIELAALSLGAKRWGTIKDITIPAILPSILTGALFAFLVSFDEVVITVFLTGALGPTLPVRIFSSLTMAVSPIIASASALQVLAALFLLVQLNLLRRWQARRVLNVLSTE